VISLFHWIFSRFSVSSLTRPSGQAQSSAPELGHFVLAKLLGRCGLRARGSARKGAWQS
jgi:hypothetical protein